MLTTIGYRLGDRIALLSPPRQTPPRWLRMHYVSPADPIERQLRALNELRPSLLYGKPAALGLLATLACRPSAAFHELRALATTGETFGDTTKSYLEASFGAPVFDVYGAVETGIMAWECAHRTGMHIGEDTVILEFLPSACDDMQRIVVTTLENRGMPLVRYEIGDLGVLAHEVACPCGRQFRRIERLEGRLVDCLRLPDGHFVRPGRLEHAISNIAGIERFQIVQEQVDLVMIRLQGREDSKVMGAVERAMADLVGQKVRVRVRWEANLDHPPGRKFRLVERSPTVSPNSVDRGLE